MSNPNQLYDDMERLNALYEELCWAHDDELVFTHENGRVIIYNKTQEQEQWTKEQNVLMDGQQWLVSLQLWDHMQQQVNLFPEYGKMMLLATLMFGAFIIHSMFTEDVDDDDHFDGGMLIPAQNPIQ